MTIIFPSFPSPCSGGGNDGGFDFRKGGNDGNGAEDGSLFS